MTYNPYPDHVTVSIEAPPPLAPLNTSQQMTSGSSRFKSGASSGTADISFNFSKASATGSVSGRSPSTGGPTGRPSGSRRASGVRSSSGPGRGRQSVNPVTVTVASSLKLGVSTSGFNSSQTAASSKANLAKSSSTSHRPQ